MEVETAPSLLCVFKDFGDGVACCNGAVVLGEAFERFPGQVEAVEGCVFALQGEHDAKALGIVVKAAVVLHDLVEGAFTGVTERGVAHVMGERQHLGQVFVEAELAGDGAGDLGDFEGVREAGAVVVAFVEDEDLGFVNEATKGGGVEYAVAVALKRAASGARTFGMGASARGDGGGGVMSGGAVAGGKTCAVVLGR